MRKIMEKINELITSIRIIIAFKKERGYTWKETFDFLNKLNKAVEISDKASKYIGQVKELDNSFKEEGENKCE